MSSAHSDHTFLHPASGAVILALDWLLFSGSVLSLGLGTGVLAFTGFVLGLIGVSFVQHRYGQEPMITSGLKGVVAGMVVGVPFPIAGTAVGGIVLSLSGLGRWKQRLLGRSKDTAQSEADAPGQSKAPDEISAGKRTRSSS